MTAGRFTWMLVALCAGVFLVTSAGASTAPFLNFIARDLSVTLPDVVTFAGGSAALESRSQSIEQEIQDANMFSGDWSQPILFYPDGSSSDAWVIVANEREVGIRVSLRGMTSASRLSEVTNVEQLFDEAELESP